MNVFSLITELQLFQVHVLHVCSYNVHDAVQVGVGVVELLHGEDDDAVG